MSRLICLVVFFVASSSLQAQERNWSDNTGNFNINAELVSVKATSVILRKSDGEEISVPLARLSKDDQQFVKKWKADQKKPAKADNAIDWIADVKCKVTAKRESGFDQNFQSNDPKPNVVVDIDIFGKATAQAISYGKLRIDSFKDGSGSDLKVADREFGADLAEEMEDVERDEESFFGQHPRDGIRVTLTTIDKTGSVKKVSLVEGKIDVLTGGTPKTETIKDVSTFRNGPVDSAVLKELGIKCEFTRSANEIKLEMEGKSNLAGMKFVNARGKSITPDGWSSSGWDENCEYAFDFEKIPSADLVIEFRVNPEIVTLPFSGKNVNIK